VADVHGAADLSPDQRRGLASLDGLAASMAAARRRVQPRPAPQLPEGTRAAAAFRDVAGGRVVTFGVEERRTYATPELQERHESLRSRHRDIAEKIRYLAALGGGQPEEAGLPQADVLDVRLTVLLGMLFPQDTPKGQGQRLDYEHRVAARIMDLLDQLEDAISADQLSEGAALPREALERMGDRAGFRAPAAQRESQE
jgi:hypothetical protein